MNFIKSLPNLFLVSCILFLLPEHSLALWVNSEKLDTLHFTGPQLQDFKMNSNGDGFAVWTNALGRSCDLFGHKD